MTDAHETEQHLEFFWLLEHGGKDADSILVSLLKYRSRSVVIEMLCLALESGKGSGTASIGLDDAVQYMPFMYWTVKQGISWVVADHHEQILLTVTGRTTNAHELFGIDLSEHELAEELGFVLPTIEKLHDVSTYVW